MKKLKVVFMGTPTFSVPVLEKLIETTNKLDKKTAANEMAKADTARYIAQDTARYKAQGAKVRDITK